MIIKVADEETFDALKLACGAFNRLAIL